MHLLGGRKETRAHNSNVQEHWNFEEVRCFFAYSLSSFWVCTMHSGTRARAAQLHCEGSPATPVPCHGDDIAENSWWEVALFALPPGNCYWVRFSLQAHISSLLSAKQKLKSQVQSWDFKVCQSCSALWHAAMYPWCQGPKWDTLAYFQGRKHRGILHLASQRCSTYVIPKECPPGLPDNSKRHQPFSLKLNLWKQLKHF